MICILFNLCKPVNKNIYMNYLHKCLKKIGTDYLNTIIRTSNRRRQVCLNSTENVIYCYKLHIKVNCTVL